MTIYSKHYDEFPVEIKNLDDQEWKDFGDVLDGLWKKLLDKVVGMGDFWDIEKVPAFMLPFLSMAFRAGINIGDPDRVKRKKIVNALARHKEKGLKDSLVSEIQMVTGVEPVFFIEQLTSYMIWESRNNLMPFPNDFMMWDSQHNLSGGGMGWNAQAYSSEGQHRGIIFCNLKVYPINAEVLQRVLGVFRYAGAAYFRYMIGALVEDEGWILYSQVN